MVEADEVCVAVINLKVELDWHTSQKTTLLLLKGYFGFASCLWWFQYLAFIKSFRARRFIVKLCQ